MNRRIHTPELIDIGPSCYTKKEYRDCLVQLGRIGRFLGGNRSSFWGFNQLATIPKSILDVGCGGGQLTIQLGQKYSEAKVKGIDLSSEAIAFANELREKSALKNVEFAVPLTTHLDELPKSYDVVTATLVCHHLSDDDLIDFLKRSVTVAQEAVIVNDLHRHLLASVGFMAVTPLFPNRLIFHDGLLSIKKGFKRADWEHYLAAAGIPTHAWSLSWHWAFRWILMIYPGKI